MRFTIDDDDWEHGEKVIIEIADGEGGIHEVTATARWLELMEREGKARRIPSVPLKIITPTGECTDTF